MSLTFVFAVAWFCVGFALTFDDLLDLVMHTAEFQLNDTSVGTEVCSISNESSV